MSVESLLHMPSGKWEFDASVTHCFDDMLQRSIPQLDVMRELVTQLALLHVQPSTAVVDLGCSNGGALQPIITRCHDKTCKFIGIETSTPMVDAAKLKLNNSIQHGSCTIIPHDLRTGLPSLKYPPSVALAILTLMFIPINYRQSIVSQIYRQLEPGGVFVVVEKILGDGAHIDSTFVSM